MAGDILLLYSKYKTALIRKLRFG